MTGSATGGGAPDGDRSLFSVTRRSLLLILLLSVAWVAVFEGRIGPGPDRQVFGLPDRWEGPPWFTPSAAGNPAGPAAIMINGPRLTYVGINDANAAALIGPGGYRMTRRLIVDEWNAGETMLLSPDGRAVAIPAGNLPASGGIAVQDLVRGTVGRPITQRGQGTERVLSTGAVGVRALAWMPDSRHLVIGDAEPPTPSGVSGAVGAGSELGILEVDTGAYRRLANVEGVLAPASVAPSQDGRRLAVQVGDSVVVMRVNDGGELARFPIPRGALLAGKAAWSPDGTSLVIMTPVPAGDPLAKTWRPRLVDAVTGEIRAGTPLPTVDDAAAVRAVGWRPDGDVVAVAYRPERTTYSRDPRRRTSFADVRRADLLALRPGAAVPRTLLRPADQNLALDVAQDAVSSGVTFVTPPQPFLYLPTPVVWAGLLLCAGVLLQLLHRARHVRRRTSGIPPPKPRLTRTP